MVGGIISIPFYQFLGKALGHEGIELLDFGDEYLPEDNSCFSSPERQGIVRVDVCPVDFGGVFDERFLNSVYFIPYRWHPIIFPAYHYSVFF
jgi:hypothetical protein